MPIEKSAYEALLKEANEKNIYRYSVAVIITKDSKILIVKRSDKDTFMPGFYELPGGGVGERELIEDVITREVKEETGLKVTEVKEYVGSFDYTYSDGIATREFTFYVSTENTDVKLSGEHSDFAFVSNENASDYQISENIKKLMDKFWQTEKH